jgi:hypothetical protein
VKAAVVSDLVLGVHVAGDTTAGANVTVDTLATLVATTLWSTGE